MPTGIYPRTKEHNGKISEAQMGEKHWNFGKHLSEELKSKLRQIAIKDRRGYKYGFKKGMKQPKKWVEKRAKKHSGENHENWKGGLKMKRGYYYIRISVRKYIKRSRFVMSKFLNRPLKKKEMVHHINGVKTDDRPENLKIFTSQRKHLHEHKLLRLSR